MLKDSHTKARRSRSPPGCDRLRRLRRLRRQILHLLTPSFWQLSQNCWQIPSKSTYQIGLQNDAHGKQSSTFASSPGTPHPRDLRPGTSARVHLPGSLPYPVYPFHAPSTAPRYPFYLPSMVGIGGEWWGLVGRHLQRHPVWRLGTRYNVMGGGGKSARLFAICFILETNLVGCFSSFCDTVLQK